MKHFLALLLLPLIIMCGCQQPRSGSTTAQDSGKIMRVETATEKSMQANDVEDWVPPESDAQSTPIVVLDTNYGPITIALDPVRAPITTNNFLSYVRSGHYNGVIFHRIEPNFVIQGGNFTPDLRSRNTNAPIRNESGNGLQNQRGTLSMARTPDPNSATDQFFINLSNNTNLNATPTRPGYAVFGHVTSGMDVVDKIARVETSARGPHTKLPDDPVIITNAYVQQ